MKLIILLLRNRDQFIKVVGVFSPEGVMYRNIGWSPMGEVVLRFKALKGRHILS